MLEQQTTVSMASYSGQEFRTCSPGLHLLWTLGEAAMVSHNLEVALLEGPVAQPAPALLELPDPISLHMRDQSFTSFRENSSSCKLEMAPSLLETSKPRTHTNLTMRATCARNVPSLRTKHSSTLDSRLR